MIATNQMKKMKKRRELDALVNGKGGRRKKGQHELLRNDSESSEVEEFSIPPKSVLRNGNSCRFCATCTTVCGFFLLALCIAAIAGLVWVHIELKKEVDQLRTQLGTVQTSPQKGLIEVTSKLNDVEKNFLDFKHELTDIPQDISSLKAQVSDLKKNVSDLARRSKELPVKSPVEDQDLAKSVADLGSKVTTIEKGYETLATHIHQTLDEHSQKLQELAQDLDGLNSTMLTTHHQQAVTMAQLHNVTENQNLRIGLVEAKPGSLSHDKIKKTVENTIHSVFEEILANITESWRAQDAETMAKMQTEVDNCTDSIKHLGENLGDKQETLDMVVEPLTEIQKDLVALRNRSLHSFVQLQKNMTSLDQRLTATEDTLSATIANAANDKLPSVPASTSTLSTVMSENRSDQKTTGALDYEDQSTVTATPLDEESPDDGESEDSGTAGTRYLDISYIAPGEDPKARFYRWDTSGDFQLSYEELHTALGADVPSKEEFQQALDHCDTNSDGLFNLAEFRHAVNFDPQQTQ